MTDLCRTNTPVPTRQPRPTIHDAKTAASTSDATVVLKDDDDTDGEEADLCTAVQLTTVDFTLEKTSCKKKVKDADAPPAVTNPPKSPGIWPKQVQGPTQSVLAVLSIKSPSLTAPPQTVTTNSHPHPAPPPLFV